MALMRLHYGTAVFALYPYESLYGDVAQLARAPALQAGGRGFDSHRLHLLLIQTVGWFSSLS